MRAEQGRSRGWSDREVVAVGKRGSEGRRARRVSVVRAHSPFSSSLSPCKARSSSFVRWALGARSASLCTLPAKHQQNGTNQEGYVSTRGGSISTSTKSSAWQARCSRSRRFCECAFAFSDL